ncbi:MAG: histidinol-phosphate transaminase [Bacillota bacterium]|nr:histidinol-phosphate transaminase [Bacillota bacterium]
MSKYWSDTIRNIKPYVPGEQPQDMKYIKLNTNENPYPPSPKVMEAIQNYDLRRLRLYPDNECNGVRKAAADYYGLEKSQVFVGNGSDEVLAFAFMAFFNPGSTILFPEISYSFYPVYCELFKINFKTVPLDEEFNIGTNGFFQPNNGIVIANPNAPTAKCMSTEQIISILEKNPENVVIIDEAYIDYGGESMMKYIKDYPNLLIISTFSKSRSLAGLRIGLAFGQVELIEGINRVKNSINSYTIDSIALKGAEAAFADEAYFQENRKRIIKTRSRVISALKKMNFQVTDSCANFLFIGHQQCPAATIFKELRNRGILVRYFNKPKIDNYLRVSIGSDEEMDEFLKAVNEIITDFI